MSTSMITSDGIIYETIDSTTAQVSDYITSSNNIGLTIRSTVTINSSLLTVTTIKGFAFSNFSTLTSITIPEGITQILNNAFQSCRGLTSLTIPTSVIHIGDSVFLNCNNLINLNLHDAITNIGTYAFQNCYSLTSFTIPASITSINHYIFRNCNGLTSLNIHANIISIGNAAFQGCYRLTTLNIPSNITILYISTFHGCYGLTSLTIPSSVTSIGDSVFLGCYGLTSLTIPNSVTSISQQAFAGCSGLTNFTIPNNITIINKSTFQGCGNLNDITIPDGITSIGITCFLNCSSLTNMIIPNNVTSIENDAFKGCNNLINLTIQNVSIINKVNTNSFMNVSTNVTSVINFTGIGNLLSLTPTWQIIASYFHIKLPSLSLTFSILSQTYGSSSFSITTPTSNSDGPFTYTSSNTNVATINDNNVTITGVGTTSIRAYQVASGYYLSGFIDAPFTVTKGIPLYGTFYIPSKLLDDNPFSITAPTSTNTFTPFTYTSSDTNVATITRSEDDTEDVVIINGVGTTRITASQAETENYFSGSIYDDFTVVANQITTIIEDFTIPNKKHGSRPFSITAPPSNSNGPFTYTSSDTNVATINGSIVTITGDGSCNIVASQDVFEIYTAASSNPVTFEVTETTRASPIDLTDNLDLAYFLTTQSTYGNITQSIQISNNVLSSIHNKVLFTNNTNGINITKSNNI